MYLTEEQKKLYAQVQQLYKQIEEKSKDKFFPREKLVEATKQIELILKSIEANQFYFYQPLPNLLSFHESHLRERLVIGGNRSGKTHSGCWEALAFALDVERFKKLPPKKGGKRIGWIVSISNEVQRDIIQEKFKLLVPPNSFSKIVKRDTARDFWDIIYFKNGNEIHFKTAEQKRRKFQGASIDWAWIDEEIPEDIFHEIKMRLVDRDGYLWLTLTPLEGYTYISEYREIAEEYPDSVGIWEIDTRENYYIPQDALERITYGMTEEERLIRLTGSGSKDRERVYPPLGSKAFYTKHEDLYINKEKDIIIAALDVGMNDPTALLVAKVDNNNNVIIFDEYYERGKLLPQACREVGMKLKDYKNLLYLVIDVSVLRRDPNTGKSYYDVIRESFREVGLYNVNILMSGRNNSIFTGINIVQQYIDNTMRHKGREMLIVSDALKWFQYEAKRYRWKDIGGSKAVADHLMDALRYLLERKPKPFMDRDTQKELISNKPRATWRRNRHALNKRDLRIRDKYTKY